MAKQSSYSVAPSDESRSGILSRGALLGVVGVALVGLALVFPKTDLLSRLRSGVGGEGADNELTIAYLKNLIRTEKADTGLHLLLAERLIAQREFNEAEKILKESRPLFDRLGEDINRWKKVNTDLAWARYHWYKAQVENIERALEKPDLSASARKNLLIQLEKNKAILASSQSLIQVQLDQQARKPEKKLSPAQALEMMKQARELDMSQLAEDLLIKLSEMPDLSIAEIEKIARELIARGKLQESAKLYFLAKNKSQDPKERQEFLQRAIKTLLATGKPLLAYEAAVKEHDPLQEGDPYYWQLVDLALAAGVPREAIGHLAKVVPPSWDAATLAAKLTPAQLSKAMDVGMVAADLSNTYKLITASLIQNPNDHAMREKYAQVSEWLSKPNEALKAWLELMQKAAQVKAMENVMRLAPMLYDDDALLAAFSFLEKNRALTLEEVQRIIDIYERVGEPARGIALLDRLQNQLPLPSVLMMRAFLLDRMGKTLEAAAALEQLRQASGGKLERIQAIRLAQLNLRSGNYAAALNALLSYGADPNARPFDIPYWELVADIAYEANRSDVYPSALFALLNASTEKMLLTDYQIERMLRYPLDSDNPQQARELAAKLYPKVQTQSAQDMVAVLWLDALVVAPERASFELWKKALTPEHLLRIAKNPEVLTRRAAVYASLGEKKLAAQDYRASLALKDDKATRISYWWLLIDMADLHGLQREIASGGAGIRRDPDYLEVQGAAWQILGNWRRAVSFYSQQTKQEAKANDYLWLANYADVLDSAGEGAVALRVRRHAFALLSPQLNKLDTLKKREATQALIVRLRLSEMFASGDEKMRLAALLGKVLKDEELPADLAKQANDLIISWALGSPHGSGPAGARTELSRQWLWMQQARKAIDRNAAIARGEAVQPNGIPGNSQNYAKMALALVENDVQTLDWLMENAARDFQQLDQLNALRQLSARNPVRLWQAATQAVELGQRDAETLKSDEQQEAMEADLLKLASRAKIEFVSRKQATIQTTGLRTSANISISPRLRMTFNLSNLNHESMNPQVIAKGPYPDKEAKIGFAHAIDGGEVAGALTLRNAFDKAAGLLLKVTRQITARSSLQALLEIRQRSEDSPALAIAGVQDKIAAQYSYRMAKDLDLIADAAHTRYSTQGGAPLGHSTAGGLQAIYHLRREYPDWYAKAGIRRLTSRADGSPEPATARLTPNGQIPNADFFVPQGGTTISLYAGWGQTQMLDNINAYSRAIRPYAEVGLEHRLSGQHNGQTIAAQTSKLARFGLRGSVLGRDQLAAGLEIRPTANGQTAKEFRVQYEWIGDR